MISYPSRRICLLLLLLAAGLSCRKTPTPGLPAAGPLAPGVERPPSAPLPSVSAPPSTTSETRESEPTAGRWATVLLPPPATIAVPPPPHGDSARRELGELRRISARRSPEVIRSVAWWDAGAVRRWNEIARGLTASQRLNSCQGARLFALLAVAQYDALVATWHYKSLYKRDAPPASAGFRPAAVERRERYSYPSEDAAVAAASASVLAHLLNSEEKFLWQNAQSHRDSRLWAGAAYPSDVEAGWNIGLAAAEKVKKWGEADGSKAAHRGVVAKEAGKWWAERQTFPAWGKVKPWLIGSGADFRAPAPPPTDSPKFKAAMREVRAVADTRSAEQLLVAQYWDLGVGGISVPGMWDQIGIDAMERARFSEPRTARALALANMAMMDASIACWETKYYYRVVRPPAADAEVDTVMDVPLHPSYTSGHAAFSGAAAAVFGYVLPEKADWFDALAQEAAMSRLYGGIHTRMDDDEGLKQGRAVAALAIERGKKDGSPPL